MIWLPSPLPPRLHSAISHLILCCRESNFAMAVELTGGALLGVVFQQAYTGGLSIYKILTGSARKKLEETVNNLLPAVEEICERGSGAPPNFSLHKFQEFQEKIITGIRQIDECQTSCICFRSCRVEKRVKKLEKDVSDFIRFEHPFILSLQQIREQISHSDRMETLMEGQSSNLARLEDIKRLVEALFEVGGPGHECFFRLVEQISQRNSQPAQLENVIEGQNTQSTQLEDVGEEMESRSSGVKQVQHSQISQAQDPFPYLVGFDDHIMELKKFVFEKRVNVVGIAARRGAGKSTLAKAICNDREIREYFMQRVIHILVPEIPDLVSMLKIMWENIIGVPAPNFKNAEDAHINLQSQIKLTKSEPILLLLDDVPPKIQLEKLLFVGEQITTLVTTRDKYTIPKGTKIRVYELPLLQKEHALSLFCYNAFRQPTIPIGHDKELVMKVAEECNGLPRALKEIGSSLYGKSVPFWKYTRDALATGKASYDYEINSLLKRLETSINALNSAEKQCFLDLALFPKERTIPSNALLDIWVYVRRMKRDDALLLLRKFEAYNLLDLKRDPWTPESRDDSMNSYSISQHDVIRQLALYLVEQDNENHFSRLYMPQKQPELPEEWQTDGDHVSRAQIVSIHTGTMKDTQSPAMDFPVAEALVLYFSAGEYCIPTFLHTMKMLKVLIIHNDNAQIAKLNGVADFQILSKLKSLHLEKLIVPPLHEVCKALKSLQKIYLSLCEGLGKDKIFNLPALLEFNVDHCSGLEELPTGICCSKSLEMLSITHCHRLAKLPDDLDKLESLKEIRLCQSLGLEALPPSICRLAKLELLNISSCMRLKVNRNKNPKLKETFQSIAQMTSLRKLICDKDNEQLIRRSSKPDLEVVAVVEDFSLDWLDYETN